jgi:cytosine/adenosine deaminase-related metal-dependent hydrolase
VSAGRIVAIEPRSRRKPDFDLGNAAILPGLVNAHTHLDLTGLRGAVRPGASFTQWLRRVIQGRRTLTDKEVARAVSDGMAESIRYGVTLLGDIAAGGRSWTHLAAGPIRATVYYELLGLKRDRARNACSAVRAWLAELQASPTCRPGLSPHAPYSVRSSLFRLVASAACARRLPIAIHLLESSAEVELLGQRRGEFVPFLQELNAWDPAALMHDGGELIRLYAGLTAVSFVHANYLDPNLTPLAPGTTVVYCPRTHDAFGHPPHPFRELLRVGARVALGTDSLASNPDLDVLTEARYLHRRYPDVAGSDLLRMATLSGAEALGWAQVTGSLEAGKSADIVVVPLPDGNTDDPHDLIFDSAALVRAAMCQGRWIHNPGRIADLPST